MIAKTRWVKPGMMNIEELEKLLYTDGEVREQMESRRLRVRAKRTLGRAYPVMEPVEGHMVSEPDEGKSESFCPGFAPSGPWPVPARTASGDQSVLLRS